MKYIDFWDTVQPDDYSGVKGRGVGYYTSAYDDSLAKAADAGSDYKAKQDKEIKDIVDAEKVARVETDGEAK